MSLAVSTDNLLALAKSRSPADRERLLFGVADLCDATGGQMAADPKLQATLSAIFMTLVVEAERDLRRRLAEKLADAEWAPPALINVLALDDIEIARPVIAASPVLKDADLIRLLVEATIEHQIEVARRPALGPTVIDAILDGAEPAVLAALAGNIQTTLSSDHMIQLVRAARRMAAVRAPLSRHPQLPHDLALQLYVWVGQSLRSALSERFRFDPAVLDAALAQAISETHAGETASPEAPATWAREGEQAEMEGRLIAKLDAAGQLRPGYLLRALKEGKLSLFAGALTTLGRFRPEDVRTALESPRPELLALACMAVGIDRSAFPTLLELVRKLNGGKPGSENGQEKSGALGSLSPDIAAAAFRQAARPV